MYNTWGLYEGGVGEKCPQKNFVGNFFSSKIKVQLKMYKVNDVMSNFNIWDNQFIEHENTFNFMYNTCGLYEGGLGEKGPKKISLKKPPL